MEVQIEQPKIATTKKEAKEGKCELPNSSSVTKLIKKCQCRCIICKNIIYLGIYSYKFWETIHQTANLWLGNIIVGNPDFVIGSFLVIKISKTSKTLELCDLVVYCMN